MDILDNKNILDKKKTWTTNSDHWKMQISYANHICYSFWRKIKKNTEQKFYKKKPRNFEIILKNYLQHHREKFNDRTNQLK